MYSISMVERNHDTPLRDAAKDALGHRDCTRKILLRIFTGMDTGLTPSVRRGSLGMHMIMSIICKG